MPRRVLHDQYFKQAKARGYVARSAFKLVEIQEKKRLIHKGDHVLDLGCAPGAWLQVASEIVGPTGRVAGVDLQDLRTDILRGEAHIDALQGDVFDLAASELVTIGAREAMPYDVLLSDMAPSTSGAGGGSADHFLSVRLCDRVLDLCPRVLKGGGNLAMKVFEGEAYRDLLDRAGELFRDVKGFKPKASRNVSREMYVIAKGFRGFASA